MAYEAVNIGEGTGKAIAVDTVSGKEIQVVKIDVGADGASVGPVSSANPMPVSLSATDLAALENIIALLPASLGQKTMAASLPVVFASDQSALPISQPGLSGGITQTVTTLTNATTAYPIPATPLAGRATMLVQACDTNTAAIYIGKSTVTADTASTGGTKLLPGQSVPINLAAAVLLYAASATAGQKVSTLEAAA